MSISNNDYFNKPYEFKMAQSRGPSLGVDTTFQRPHFAFAPPPPPPPFMTQTTTANYVGNLGQDHLSQKVPEISHVSKALNIYQGAENFIKSYQEATAAGQSAIRATACGSVDAATNTGVTSGLQTVVTTVSRLAGPPLLGFIATQPELYPAVPLILSTGDAAYKAAEPVGYYSGKMAQYGCNKAFDALNAWK